MKNSKYKNKEKEFYLNIKTGYTLTTFLKYLYKKKGNGFWTVRR